MLASSQQRSTGKIPVIPMLDNKAPSGPLIAASADGAAVRLSHLAAVTADLGSSGSGEADQASSHGCHSVVGHSRCSVT